MNIEEAIEILKNSKKLYLKEKIDSDILEEAIETLLTAYENLKSYNRGTKEALKVAEDLERQANKEAGDWEARYFKLEAELEKEKEKNKGLEEKIKKYINKIQKELDKYKIKNTNTYIQIEGNPEINGLLIQKATLEELI